MVYKSLLLVIGGLGGFLFRRWLRRNIVSCKSKATLEDKVAIVTGGTSGIGRATTIEFVRRKCHVILACRNKQLGDALANSIKTDGSKGRVTVIPLDLSSLQSVRQFVDVLALHSETFPRVDILVNNAGVFGPPSPFTEDGFESHFGINHLGHFLLTQLLLKKGLISQGARVITVASSLANKGDLNLDYSKLFNEELSQLPASKLYANSKLANCMFARELHRQCSASKSLLSLCVHTDGMINTGLFRYAIAEWSTLMHPLLRFLAWFFLLSPKDGCQTLLHCALAPEHELVSGEFYGKCRIEPWLRKQLTDDVTEHIWKLSEQLCSSKTSD